MISKCGYVHEIMYSGSQKLCKQISLSLFLFCFSFSLFVLIEVTQQAKLICIGHPAPINDVTDDKVLLLVAMGSDSILLLQSSNEGITWTSARNITSMITTSPWSGDHIAPGYPGGIQLPSGRLIQGKLLNFS